MNIFRKLIGPSRIVSLASRSVYKELCPKYKNKVFDFEINFVRNMSQKSITSFFKVTPKKIVEANQEIPIQELTSKDAENCETAPKTNEKEKKSSKRQRLDSSGSESDTKNVSTKSPSLDSPEKKKKVKRQRIESSSSESELTPKSPVKSEEKVLKLEKSNKPPRTYNSPKSKKAKLKEFKEENASISKNNVTEVKRSPSPKKENSNIVKEENSPSVKPENSLDVKKETGEEIKVEETAEKVPEAEYNPAKPRYHPINDACWSKGEEVPYLALAKTLEVIEATSSRLKIIEILSNYFRSVIALTPEDLLPSIYMCLNQLAPAYHNLELGIAETYLMKAIGQCTGRTLAQVKAAAHKCGDLGRVAEQARAAQRTMCTPPPLTARRVFAALKDIAAMTGQASVNKKISKIQSLYVACRYSEARYLIRCLEGKLRIGLAEQSVLQALALAAATTPPGQHVLDASRGLPAERFKALVEEHALTIKTTYCECPNYEALVGVLVREGVAALPARCRLTPGVPLKPMLAHPTRGVHHVFDRFEKEEFTCEWKYDGERAQIHVPAAGGSDGDGDGDGATPDLTKAAIFSRNQENNTSKYPDIVRRLPSLLKPSVSSCVLDCEAVAYDTHNKQILPFQVLSTRKRKDATESDIKVQVCVFVFDLLYFNGRPLVREPLAERRRLLREHFNEREGEWQFATCKDCTSTEEVQQFLEEAVRGSCEGLMVKALRGPRARYDIARRSRNWLKLKKDYLEGVGDTVDAVVLGAYCGRGRRAGLYGGFLLACYDALADEYQALCKIGTGFSDDDLQRLSAALQPHVIDAPRTYYRYDVAHCADVWFSAARVWEVRCADLSLSPAHRAAIGLVDPDKGISLRFPRFVRTRDDKAPEQATSAQQIADLYLAQDQVRNQPAKLNHHDDFY